jgi:hypothetical protein
LWRHETFMPRSDMPTLGKIILEQIMGAGATEEQVADVDATLVQDIEENLYHK